MSQKGLTVLSLFDGISCGRVALERAGLSIESYLASEVDKYAITIAQKNYPDTVQLGNIRNVSDLIKSGKIGHVDLLLGGSPCQSFSVSGKRQGMVTEDNIEITTLKQYLQLKSEGFEFKGQSYLFWEYAYVLRLLKEINPNIKFLLENVRMVKKWSDVITKELDVDFVCINSSLVSAQNRKRLYWCNWKVEQPKDRGILLKNIVHETTDLESIMGDSWCKWFKKNAEFQLSKKYSTLSPEKAITMTARQYASWNGNFIYEALSEYIVPFDKTLQILDKEVEKGKVGYFNKGSQGDRVYYIHDKSVTLTGHGGGRGAKTGLYLFGCITPDRVNKRQNGQRFNDGQKFYTLTAQDKHGVLIEGYIRKLTPIECERLQGLEDCYTEGVSNSQRYKMLGNGWNVDTIVHILQENNM